MTKPRRSFLPVCLALWVQGCAWMPEDGTRAQLLPVPGLSDTEGSEREAEQRVRNWPKAEWWRDFHNTELDRLITTALQGSPTLRVAEARTRQAGALADYQAAEMLPSVGAALILTHRRFSANDFYGPNGGKTFTGAYVDPIVFRYHLDLWGKDRAALESALGKMRAQAAESALARLVLSTSIARDYFRLCAVEDGAALADALAVKAEDKLRLARLRWDRGLAVQDPVHVATQKWEAVRQAAARLHTEAQILRHRLAAWAGQGPDWGQGIQVSASVFAERFPLPENLPLGLLVHRPDVAAALSRVEAAAQSVKVAKTKFYPDVNLVGFAGLRALNLKDLFLTHGSSLAYSIGPTVTLPLFEGGRLEAELSHEQAGYDAAIENYNAALLNAVQQVADALAAWRDSLVQDAAQERAIQAAEAEAALAGRRYDAGLSVRDATIDAEYTLIEQRLKQRALEAEHLQSAVGLIEALGGGYDRPAVAQAAR